MTVTFQWYWDQASHLSNLLSVHMVPGWPDRFLLEDSVRLLDWFLFPSRSSLFPLTWGTIVFLVTSCSHVNRVALAALVYSDVWLLPFVVVMWPHVSLLFENLMFTVRVRSLFLSLLDWRSLFHCITTVLLCRYSIANFGFFREIGNSLNYFVVRSVILSSTIRLMNFPQVVWSVDFHFMTTDQFLVQSLLPVSSFLR